MTTHQVDRRPDDPGRRHRAGKRERGGARRASELDCLSLSLSLLLLSLFLSLGAVTRDDRAQADESFLSS